MFSQAKRLAPAVKASARAFSTTRPASDVSKLTLVGRLGADPVRRETAAGKPYYTYLIATAAGIAQKREDGTYTPAPTSWHTVFAFNEASHVGIARLGKGSTVYVEAELEMRPADAINGQAVHDRILLRHGIARAIDRKKPESEEGVEQAELET